MTVTVTFSMVLMQLYASHNHKLCVILVSKSHKEERARYTVPFFLGRINMITVNYYTGNWGMTGIRLQLLN